jgi:hypothetical protein
MSRRKQDTKNGAGSTTAPPTAVAWYTREEWDAVRREASDPEVFDASYDEWQTNATRVLDQLREQGVPVQRIFVGAAELRTWCAQQGIPRNGKARSSYAAQKLRYLHEQKPQGAA